MTTSQNADALIAEYIEANPYGGGAADAWVKGHHVPVWALVSTALVTTGDRVAERIAAAYELPMSAVVAALAYYEQHKAAFAERLAENDAA